MYYMFTRWFMRDNYHLVLLFHNNLNLIKLLYFLISRHKVNDIDHLILDPPMYFYQLYVD